MLPILVRKAVPCRSIAGVSPDSRDVGPGDDFVQAFGGGVLVPPDDVAADHAALLFVAGVVCAVKGEVAQGGELGLD
jgi:hypothetical protein